MMQAEGMNASLDVSTHIHWPRRAPGRRLRQTVGDSGPGSELPFTLCCGRASIQGQMCSP